MQRRDLRLTQIHLKIAPIYENSRQVVQVFLKNGQTIDHAVHHLPVPVTQNAI